MLTLPFGAVWLGVNIYVQWLLWPHRRVQESDDSRTARTNMVWVCITSWGLAGIVEMSLAATGYAGVSPSMLLVPAAMIGLAVGLAGEAAWSEGGRAETRRDLQRQNEVASGK